MRDVREFDLSVVLSVTHRLPVDPAVRGEILTHLTGLVLSPEDAEKALEVCSVGLVEQHPRLNGVPARPPFTAEDTESMNAWVERQKTLLGAQVLAVEPLPDGRYERWGR